MSGGHFNYNQHRINDIVTEIEHLIEQNEDKSLDEYGMTRGWGFSDATIACFKNGLKALRIAEVYAQRIDWLVSGDDGEESFHHRLAEDLDELEGK